MLNIDFISASLNEKTREKFELLQKRLRELEKVLIAYSGGVDSTFLLAVARQQLGEKAVAVIATSETYPESELEMALTTARQLAVEPLVITTSELTNSAFTANPPERCYYCKKELFASLKKVAREQGINWIVDGTNASDGNDFRPGRKAAAEEGVISPLAECGLTKEEIRHLARLIGLPNWNKPAMACLASRIPYGQKITAEALQRVARAEAFLREKGFPQNRVRHHFPLARIEVPLAEIPRLTTGSLAEEIVSYFRQLGFTYVTVDLAGLRSGSMNEVLPREITKRS
ncbi:MAG: pyridinium-3,5-biscarboxylic acid mononucleotide sulfurtransferase [Eubacteriales bacterium]|nr:pyridinium-3,5-biscarboxylic acid mononucleotide sulfurtransferase [Eubacteriales bacterium]MDN5363589.1 pyridinium-3,5-biscarboxylic acid mononucleotide sulfurtransferase [Eubacteriales bacterium]